MRVHLGSDATVHFVDKRMGTLTHATILCVQPPPASGRPALPGDCRATRGNRR